MVKVVVFWSVYIAEVKFSFDTYNQFVDKLPSYTFSSPEVSHRFKEIYFIHPVSKKP